MKGDLGLGKIIAGEGQERDAIHIAVAPVTACERLAPGVDVGFVEGKAGQVGACGACDAPIGIVDPFLRNEVEVGQRFWLFLYPNTITSLRHDWAHPAFARFDFSVVKEKVSDEEKRRAAAVIEMIAESLGVRVDDLMSHASDYLQTGEYWSEGGRFEGAWVDDDFWDAYEIVTDSKVDGAARDSFFSCAC